MKQLVCAEQIKAIAEKGQNKFYLECNTIITPAARDLAKELSVEFVKGSSVREDNDCKEITLQNSENIKKNIDRDLIYQIVKVVLEKNLLASADSLYPEGPFVTDYEPKSGLKIVRGRTVKYEALDTGDPNTKVAYREVVKKDDITSAGFLTIEKSSYQWELSNDEIDIILEGSMSVTINGETYDACQGDVLFIPQGSKVTWSSSGYVKLFYVKANWTDLME